VRHVRLRSLAVIAAGAVVLAGVLFVASTVDARAPEVTRYRLTQTAAGDDRTALITTSLEVVFSEAVDPQSAIDAFAIDPPVDGSISWNGTTMTFTPAEPLPLETAFTAEVAAGVRDLAGNASVEAAEPFEFATAGAPTVVDSEPADGADDVAVDVPIRLFFSALMDTTSVDEALRVTPRIEHELVWSGEQLEIVATAALRPGVRYEVQISTDATDLAGVALEREFSLSFTTIAGGLEPEAMVPADGADGIAVTSPIAIVFDRAVDPASISGDLLKMAPDVSGSLELVAAPGAAGLADDARRILRFTPSGALPSNTTFEVELTPGVEAADGGVLAEPLSWTFTTGAPLASLGNQVVFLSDRSGISNLWAMNPDGTSQRQLSAELSPVTDYALAPDGLSFVVADGAVLVHQRADGAQRQVLTEEDVIEYDPAFSPDGRRIAFGRADPETGGGLGLWERPVDGEDARQIELPPELGGGLTPAPTPSGGDTEAAPLFRAPRYAPDGQAIAFVDGAGRVGIVELPAARLTSAPLAATEPPVWLPDSSGILVSGADPDDVPAPEPFAPGAAVPPLAPSVAADDPAPEELGIWFLARSGTRLNETAFGRRTMQPAVDEEGTIAAIRLPPGPADPDQPPSGTVEAARDRDDDPRPISAARDLPVTSVAFPPEAGLLLLAVVDEGIWLLDIEGGELTQLSEDGTLPRWRP